MQLFAAFRRSGTWFRFDNDAQCQTAVSLVKSSAESISMSNSWRRSKNMALLVILALLNTVLLGNLKNARAAEAIDPDDIARSVLTQHNDPMRTGAYLVEKQLTPNLVKSRGMQLLYSRKIDFAGIVPDAKPAKLWAQLLYARQVPTAIGERNLVIAFTDQNTVFAYDANDERPGDMTALIWCVKLPLGSDPNNPCAKFPFNPNLNADVTEHDAALNSALTGANSTPVIDLARRWLFVVWGICKQVVFRGKASCTSEEFGVEFHLTKLDIRSGTVLQDVRIRGSIPRPSPFQIQDDFTFPIQVQVDFKPWLQFQRPGLLLAPNPSEPGRQTVYVGFGARDAEEIWKYHGWVMGYDADTLQPRGVFCSTPYRLEVGEGGGIWQGGAGLAADEAGNVYFSTGNGPGSGDPITGEDGRPFLDASDARPNNHGNSIVKLTPIRRRTGEYSFSVNAFSAAADDREHAYEWEHQTKQKNDPTNPNNPDVVFGNDIDLGAGGVTVIPGSPQVVGGGKTGVLYVLDRTTMIKVQDGIQGFENTHDDCPPPGGPEGCRYGGHPWTSESWMIGPHLHGAPTYWQVSSDKGFIFHWSEKDFLKRFDHDRLSGRLVRETVLSGDVQAEGRDASGDWVMPGGLISLSGNGVRDGILWVTLPGKEHGRILAYDAQSLGKSSLIKLWEDENVPKGLLFSKNNPPTVGDGRVFVGTHTGGKFFAYGLAKDAPLVHVPPVIVPVARIDPVPSIEVILGQLSARERAALAPPDGHRPFSLATISGALTYQARLGSHRSRLEWVLTGLTGELRDESGINPRVGYDGLGGVLATADHGLTWTGPDGSQMTWSVETSVKAPEAGNAPWALFRSVAGVALDVSPDNVLRDLRPGVPLVPAQTGGVLGAVAYAQQIGTEGGAPPKSKAHPGHRVDVPFTATYALYVSETDDGDASSGAK
jgi:hypothetical protein